MYKQCRIEKSANRQREVENQLAKMMEKQEFSKIRVCELCEQIGMPRKSFYVYFDAKEDALQALIEHTICDFDYYEADATDTSATYTFKVLKRFFEFWKEKDMVLNGLSKSGLSGILVTKIIEHTIKSEKSIPFMHWADGKMLSETVLIYSVSGLMAIVLEWHRGGCKESTGEMARKATELLTSSYFKNV